MSKDNLVKQVGLPRPDPGAGTVRDARRATSRMADSGKRDALGLAPEALAGATEHLEQMRDHRARQRAKADALVENMGRSMGASLQPRKAWADMTLRERAVAKRDDADGAKVHLETCLSSASEAQDWAEEAEAEAETAERMADEADWDLTDRGPGRGQ